MTATRIPSQPGRTDLSTHATPQRPPLRSASPDASDNLAARSPTRAHMGLDARTQATSAQARRTPRSSRRCCDPLNLLRSLRTLFDKPKPEASRSPATAALQPVHTYCDAAGHIVAHRIQDSEAFMQQMRVATQSSPLGACVRVIAKDVADEGILLVSPGGHAGACVDKNKRYIAAHNTFDARGEKSLEPGAAGRIFRLAIDEFGADKLQYFHVLTPHYTDAAKHYHVRPVGRLALDRDTRLDLLPNWDFDFFKRRFPAQADAADSPLIFAVLDPHGALGPAPAVEDLPTVADFKAGYAAQDRAIVARDEQLAWQAAHIPPAPTGSATPTSPRPAEASTSA